MEGRGDTRAEWVSSGFYYGAVLHIGTLLDELRLAVGLSKQHHDDVMVFNDRGSYGKSWSFHDIADWIEANIPVEAGTNGGHDTEVREAGGNPSTGGSPVEPAVAIEYPFGAVPEAPVSGTAPTLAAGDGITTYVVRSADGQSRRFALCEKHHEGIRLPAGTDLVPHTPFDQVECHRCLNQSLPI